MNINKDGDVSWKGTIARLRTFLDFDLTPAPTEARSEPMM